MMINRWKFVGAELGKTVKVGKTRMSKGFYQYAREKMKMKKEKELILEICNIQCRPNCI